MRIIICISLITCYTFTEKQISDLPMNLSIPITLNNHLSPHAHAHTTTAHATNIALENTMSQFTSLTALLPSLQQAAQTFPSLSASIRDLLYTHLLKITGGSTIMLYATLLTTLIRDNYYLENSDLWSHWKQECSFKQLCAQPHEALCKELILTIQQRYLNNTNPTDCITPLTHFLTAISQEDARLQTYCSRGKFLLYTWLQRLLPISEKKLARARQLRERLAFVHHLFLSWASERNWNQTTT